MQVTAQSEPTAEWEEGRLVTAGEAPADVAIPAVATTPGTYYRTYAGITFQPTNSGLTYSAIGGAVHATALPAGGYSFTLPLDLPPGATITEVVFFVVDNDATFNMTVELRSYTPETNTYSFLETQDTSGQSTVLQTIVLPVDPPIQTDLTTRSYLLRAAPGVPSSAHLLRGARVGYTVPQVFLPMVTR